MNIKSKLIEQLEILEKIQRVAMVNADFDSAIKAYHSIAECLRHIDEAEDDCICPNCEEALVKEIEAQEIANASDLPIELVKRVLAAMDKVSDNY